MVALKTPKFGFGRVVATPRAVAALQESGQSPWEFLCRHLAGDWGDVDADDRAANDQALKDGSRILSSYRLTSGERIWIITEAEDDHGHRTSTAIIRPDEY